MDKMRGHKNARQCLLNCYIYFCATSVYNSSTKEVMDVTKSERFEQLDRLLTEHDGMLQTAQVIASGIVKPIFMNMSKRKIFSRLLTEFMSPRTPGLMRCFCYICDVVRQYFPMNQRYFSMT